MVGFIIFIVFFGTSAFAQEQSGNPPLTGPEFDAYTKGKTLHYMQEGIVYGAEEYFGNQQVLWAFEDSQCISGEWFEPETGLICFIYEDISGEPKCWSFFMTNKGLRAIFNELHDPTELYETQQSSEPLFCPGPEVGA